MSFFLTKYWPELDGPYLFNDVNGFGVNINQFSQ